MKKNKFFRTGKQLFLFLGFCVILCLILYFFYWSTRKNVISNGEMTTQVSVQVVDELLNESADIISLESESLNQKIKDGADSEEILEFLTGITAAYSNVIESDTDGFYGVFNGEYLDGSGWKPDDDFAVEERPWYIVASENKGETIMTSAYADAKTGKVMISVARMLPDSNDILAVDISLTRLKKLVKNIGESNYAHCVILDSKGMAIASSLSDEGCNYYDGSSGNDKKLLAQSVLANDSVNFEQRFKEKSSLIFSEPIQNGWHAVIIMNKTSLFMNTYVNMALFATVALVFSLLMFYYINRSEVKRIEAEKSVTQAKAISSIYVSVNEINLKDKTYQLVHSYEHVRSILGHGVYTADQALNMVMNNLVTEPYLKATLDFVNLDTIVERLGDLKTITMEFVGKRLGWCRARFIVEKYTGTDNIPYVLIFAVEDINAAKLAEEKLKSESTVDNLTGCLNRKAFDERLKFYHDNKMEDNLVYISADVNGLKAVNDDLGHAAGDELIKGAACCLVKAFGQYGDVFRTGGDEFFAVIHADKDTVHKALEVAEHECSEWSSKFINSISVSAGFAGHSDYPELSINELGKVADQNMYDAKSRYYMKKGIDRRGQQDAYAAICSSYEKIILVNLTDDSFRKIFVSDKKADEDIQKHELHSEWLKEFAMDGFVHEDNREEFLKMTETEYLKDYFDKGNEIVRVHYKRKIGDDFKPVILEIARSKKYTETDQFVYFYVKNIE